MVAPVTFRSGALMRARYQITGELNPKCGSFARMADRVVVFFEERAQAFDAPTGRPGSRGDDTASLSRFNRLSGAEA